MTYILILLLLIAFLLDRKILPDHKTTKSNFSNLINKPIIWIYINKSKSSKVWESFYSRRTIDNISTLSEICIRSILSKNNDLGKINIVTDDNLNLYIPNFPGCNEKIDKQSRLNYIKYNLLYNYGGLWVPPDTLCLTNFNSILNKLNHHDLVLIKNIDNNIDDTFIACNKFNPTIKKILENSQRKILDHNYYFHNQSGLLLNKLHTVENTYIFTNNINGKYDYNNKEITTDNYVSNNLTLFKNPQMVDFLHLNESKISKEIRNNWLLRMNLGQMLETNMWITKLFRFSLHLEQQFFDETNYDLLPSKTEVIDVSKKINLPYSPYLIVTKESSRNT
uniref:Nucleotide-diphospho-sugar transferase domain-containing protein n=1 Tax=viral metagenome TaxID=1070528 RepID=A0A6C0ENC2_9ZZZZ